MCRVSWSRLHYQVKDCFAANEAPDISIYKAPAIYEPLVTAGKILPLNDLMDKYQTNDKILPGQLTPSLSPTRYTACLR